MSQTIADFKGGFNGGTRANRFTVDINWPSFASSSGGGGSSTTAVMPVLTYHAIAAKLPEQELGSIPVPWMGRVAHYAGDRDYKPWTVTIVDDISNTTSGDKTHSWLNFHKWSDALSSHTKNTVTDQTYAAGTYLKDITFKQLHDPVGGAATTGHQILRTITLKHAWPSEVGQISLDMGEGGSLVTFSVTFTYDYFTQTY